MRFFYVVVSSQLTIVAKNLANIYHLSAGSVQGKEERLEKTN